MSRKEHFEEKKFSSTKNFFIVFVGLDARNFRTFGARFFFGISEPDSLLAEEHLDLNEYFVLNENRQSAPGLSLVIHDPVDLRHKD